MGAAQKFGAGGSKGGGDSPHTPVESPDSLINTSYANILDAISEGPIVGLVNGAQSIFYDQTPLANADGSLNFTGVTWDQRTGEAEQDYITGFPAVESETSVGVELKFSQSWTQAISNLQLSAVRVRLGVSTMYQTETDGDTVGYLVNYAIDVSTDGADYVTVLTPAFAGKTTTGYQRSHRIDLPVAALGWQIRIRRLTPDSTLSAIQANTSIVSYTEVIDAKLQYPFTALVGTKIDASQFSSIPERAFRIKGRIVQVPSNYNAATRAYNGAWDGTFQLAWTDNPAWVYRDLILNNRYGLGSVITDDQVDKWGLYQIAGYCDELVGDGKGGTEPRFTTNLYLQSRNDALTVLQDMASVFRGMSYYAASEVMVSADMPSDPVFTYTNANVIAGKFSRVGSSGSTRFSVCKVSWSDRENFGATKVEYVQDAKSIALYGIRETEVTAFACVSQGQAQRMGHYILLTNQLETDTISFSVGLDGTLARPGQLIRVSDENFVGKPMAGRIKASTATTVTLDADIDAAAGDTLVIILPTGTAETRVIRGLVGRVVTVTESFSSAPVAQSIYTIETAEVVPEVYRILSVIENFGDDKLQYDVVAIQHNASKFAAIDNGAQIVTLPTTTLPSAIQAIPTGVALTTFDSVKQGLAVATMRITWNPSAGATSYNVWWRRGSSDWVYSGVTYTASMEVPGIYTGTYTARIAAVGVNGNSSLWAYSDPTDLLGKTGSPPAVTSLTATSLLFGIGLKWTFPPGAEDTQRTEIWYGPTTDVTVATKLADLAYPQSDYSLQSLLAGARFFFWARLVDRTGNIGPFYPVGNGVLGQASSDAGPILDLIAGQIGETELGQELQDKIDLIDGLQDQIDALDGLKGYDPDQVYTKGQMIVVDGHIYQAEQAVPVNTPPPNITYWEDVGDLLETAGALAEQVETHTTQISEINGVLTSQASSLEVLRAASREDDGEGDALDALRGWNATASFAREVTVRTTQNSALAESLTTLDAKVGDNESSLSELTQTVATDKQATALALEQLHTDVGGNTTDIQTQSQIVSDIEGKIDASWSVKMQYNSATGQYITAGIGLSIENGPAGLQSQFLVSADRFAIVNTIAGGAISVPFAVQGGQVFISQGFIQDGTITNAKIGSYISSTNYIAGQQGWILNKDGTLEINGVVPGQGRLVVNSLNVSVYDVNGTLRVRLGYLG